jgi:hypothetical protein
LIKAPDWVVHPEWPDWNKIVTQAVIQVDQLTVIAFIGFFQHVDATRQHPEFPEVSFLDGLEHLGVDADFDDRDSFGSFFASQNAQQAFEIRGGMVEKQVRHGLIKSFPGY